MKTLAEQAASVRRELALRRNAYPAWVREGRMRPAAADHEIECFEAVVATLDKLVVLQEAAEDIFKGPTRSMLHGHP
jgi:hypothetical protein